MKATRLMIGDWVEWNSQYVKVLSIHLRRIPDNSDTGNYFVDGRTSQGSLCGFSIDNAKPIPLTEEMLELNGFQHETLYDEIKGIKLDYDDIMTDRDYVKNVHYKGGFIHFWPHPHNDGVVCWHFEIIDNPSISNISMAITYVHELQHALRLCGLNDMADNWRVE